MCSKATHCIMRFAHAATIGSACLINDADGRETHTKIRNVSHRAQVFYRYCHYVYCTVRL